MDIEALKQQIEASKKAQDYLTSISETVGLPLIVLNSQLRLMSANRAFWDHFNLSQNIIGKEFFAALGIQGDSLLAMKKLLTEAFRVNKKIKNVEMICDFPVLGRRTLLISGSLIQWMGEMSQESQESQESQAILLSFDDITERKEHQVALRRSELRYRSLFDSIDEGFCVIEKIEGQTGGLLDFRYIEANPAFEVQSGMIGVVGKTIRQVAPSEAEGWIQSYDTVLRTGEPMRFERALISRSRTLELYSFRVEDETNRRVAVIFRDISARKHSEGEMAQLLVKEKDARTDAEGAKQTKDEFLATLSHELRTPLTSILSWSQLIQKQKFDPDKLKHGIKMIEQSAKMQGQLIDDLLDVTRIRSGKLSINFSEVDPRVPVRIAIEAVQLLAESKQIVIETEMAIQAEKILGDTDRLQQIVWNLLTNAIKFSNKGGLVRIRVEPVEIYGGKFMSIKVIDQGKGILPAFLPKLFERFSQADSSSVRVHGGLGLGLAIVRDLAQLQYGIVKAESEGVGKGATFTVLFPISSGADGFVEEAILSADSRTYDSVAPANLSGVSVMVVEDDPGTLEVLIEALNSFGAKTISCGAVADALAAFEKFKPDVLLSDISMPGEDGYSLMRKIRALGGERGGNVPSLALTAFATAGDLKNALLAGFDLHMAKPFDLIRLGHVVAELSKKRATRG